MSIDNMPVSLTEANELVLRYHRHHGPVTGHKFSIGCTDGESIVGVAIVGRPVSRYLDDGMTLEITRLCVMCRHYQSCDEPLVMVSENPIIFDKPCKTCKRYQGVKDCCSFLYAAAWRAARAIGYKKVITYILDSENGTSVKAAGYRCVGQAGGLRWTGKRKPSVDLYPAQMKLRFERDDSP